MNDFFIGGIYILKNLVDRSETPCIFYYMGDGLYNFLNLENGNKIFIDGFPGFENHNLSVSLPSDEWIENFNLAFIFKTRNFSNLLKNRNKFRIKKQMAV